MDDLIYNYMALLEAIFSDEEVLPDIILQKYGLMDITPRRIRQLEAMEMIRLHKDNMSLNQIGKRFNMSDSGVCRRIKRWV